MNGTPALQALLTPFCIGTIYAKKLYSGSVRRACIPLDMTLQCCNSLVGTQMEKERQTAHPTHAPSTREINIYAFSNLIRVNWEAIAKLRIATKEVEH